MYDRISSTGREPSSVTIVAVTKTFGPEAVSAAHGAGLRDVGENYANELLSKVADDSLASISYRGTGSLAAQLRWHFLGAIQRNKLPRLLPVVSCWQSLSRLKEVQSMSDRARSTGIALPDVFVEVNTTTDPNRGGCSSADLPKIVAAARASGLNLRGLMAVAPPGGAHVARSAFEAVAASGRDLGLMELSFGMSGDFEEALRAGSTMLRLGTALFGPRIPHTGARGL